MIIATEASEGAGSIVALDPTRRSDAAIQGWLRRVISAVGEGHLSVVVWYAGEETPLQVWRMRQSLERTHAGVRWLIVTDDAAKAALVEDKPRLVGLDSDGRRTSRAVPVGSLARVLSSMTVPTPLDPALGGSGKRVGPGPYTPWSRLVRDPLAPESIETVTINEGTSREAEVPRRDGDGILVERDRDAKATARKLAILAVPEVRKR